MTLWLITAAWLWLKQELQSKIPFVQLDELLVFSYMGKYMNF